MATYGKATGPAIALPTGGLAANTATQQYPLGQVFQDNRGNTFKYIKANEALAKGQAVTAVALAVWDSTIVTDGAVTSGDTKIHIDTSTSTLTANQYAGYYVSQAPAAGPLGMIYKISGHDPITAATGEGDVFLEDAVEEAIADGAALYIFNPNLVELTDATTERIDGIALGTITSGQYGFIQIGGVVQAVLVGHSTSAAVVVNEPLTPLAAPAGSLQGVAAGTPNEAEILTLINPLFALEAAGANTVCYVPARFR